MTVRMQREEDAMMNQTSARCPVCDGAVALAAGTAAAEIVSCPDCGCDLEVRSLDPPRLAEAPQSEEDWGE